MRRRSRSTPLDRVVGPCRVLDLRDVAPNAGDRARASGRRRSGRAGGRDPAALDRLGPKRDWHTPAFWRDAPWLTREAAEWLAARGRRRVAFDFPQDYPIRLLLDGITVPFDQHVTHDVCLRAGITLIEYLVNTAALTARAPSSAPRRC